MDIIHFGLDESEMKILGLTHEMVDAFKLWFIQEWGYELSPNGICPEEIGNPDDWVDSALVDWMEMNGYC